MPSPNEKTLAPVSPPPATTPNAAPPTVAGGTVSLVDRDGNVHAVPASQAQKAVSSGQLGWQAGTTVPMVDPVTGALKDVPAEEASKFLKRGGQMANAEQLHQQSLEKEYGGIGGGLVAAGEGVARGLTAGLSDPLATNAAWLLAGPGAAEETRKHLAGHKEANEGIALGSEIVGAVAPMFFGDEAGIADIVGSIPRGIGSAGKLAGGFAEKLVGTAAEGLLKRTGQKAIKNAATAIVEGGLWGAGQEVSAATLENRELTAESVLAAAGHAALLSGAVGGALGAAEPLAGKAWETIGSHLPGGGSIAKAADEQYIRAISANKKSFLEQMKDRFGGENATGRIANRLRSEGIVEAGDDIEKIAAKAAKAETAAVENLTAQVEKVGGKGVAIEDAVRGLEERAQAFDNKLGFAAAAHEVRAKAKEIADIYSPRALAAANELGIIEPKALDKFLMKYEVPIGDLLQQRRGLEGTINWQTDTVLAQGRKAAGRTIEDTIMSAGEKAAKEAGDDAWRAEYLAAKARYSEVRFINDVATDAATAKLRNRLISPSDYGAVMMGGMMGAAGGEGEAGHGGALAGGLGGMLMGAAHHQIRQRGNATLAVLLDKLGTFAGLSSMHAESMARLDSTIDAALMRSGRAATSGAKKVLKKVVKSEINRADYSGERFDKEAARVAGLAGHQNLDAHIQNQTAPITNHAPEVAAAVNQKTAAAARYLSSKLPPEYTKKDAMPSLTPNVKTPISKVAAIKFLKAVDAVEGGPEKIIKSAMTGKATLEEIDALKNVYPAYYAEAQQRVMLKCSSRESPLPFQTAVNLGILFDMPTVPCLAPDMIQQEQKMYAQMAPKPGPPPPSGGKKGSRTKPLKLATMMGGMFESGSQSEEGKS